MNGFLLYSLILDKAEHHTHLELPHDCPTQNDRLSKALAICNKAVESIGLEAWAHACDQCFKVQRIGDAKDSYLSESLYFMFLALCFYPDYMPVKVQYAVGDGLSIECPCCAVHDCKIHLATKHNVYCPVHVSYAQKCAVLDCNSNKASGFQTCNIDVHHALEQAY